MSYETNFERMFVQVVVEIIQAKGMNHSQFAKLAMPDTVNAVAKWRRMRNVSPSGEPQKLSLIDSLNMAKVLDKKYSELCWAVEQRLKAKKDPLLS